MITLKPKCFDDWYRERFALSDNMSSCYGHMPELANFLLEEYREKCQNGKLLGIEFGCGDGRFACEFLETFSHFTVTDKYDFSLKRTCQRAGKFADKLSTFQHVHGEPNDKVWQGFLNNNKEKFDLVITANMFHYLTEEKVSVVLNEANSLLKAGGILYVCFESDIRLSADEVEFKMPGQTDCNGERIVKNAEERGFECARKQISLLGEKIFSLPKSAQAFLGVESTHYTRNICLHEYIFIKNTTEGYRSKSIFPYKGDYALRASDSSRKMKDVQEQILNLARNTVSNLKGKTPFEICNGLRDGWNDILRLYSKNERPFRAVHLKYHNLDVDETTMAESKLDGENSQYTRSGAREYIFPAINWSSLLFKENARYSSASFCVVKETDNGDDADKDSFFIGNHISLSKNKDCPKCFGSILEKCGEIKLGGDEEDCSRDADCRAIINMLNDILSSSKNKAEIQKCLKRWREIAKKSMCYNLESAVLEIINKNVDFWGYKDVHGEFVSMRKPCGFSDAELWIIVFFFKMFLSTPNLFIAMAVDGLGSGGGAAQTGAFLTGEMPSRFDDGKDKLLYKGLFIKSCDYALAVIRRYQLELVNRKKLTYALHSAVGSIMSRNGSHNIGSHVLAALSHNVGTMPDDRVLYQYIQHRMDYIATATTDFPTWTQPTMVVGEMIKTFLSQRHLLDYITGSEGLKGWQFQNDNLGSKGKHKQTGCLKFHVRRIDKKRKDGRPLEFIDYKSEDSNVSLEHDLALAIPGGIVGQHAFFTIIENVIRNAAKHDWSSPPSYTWGLKYKKNDKGNDEVQGNLDVFIDLEDRPDEGVVNVIIYTRMSDVFDGVELSDEIAQAIKSQPEIIESCVCIGDEHYKRMRDMPLHDRQRMALAQPFIDTEGGLRRENWGLAEMKISAGYLQRREIAEIGGLDICDCNRAERTDIISPVAKKDELDESKEDDHIVERNYLSQRDGKDEFFTAPVYHLAYKFSVPKPKNILLVSDSKFLPKTWLDVASQFKKYGVSACSQSDITGKDSLDYRYIILDSFDLNKVNWRMPFRVILMKPTEVIDAVHLMPPWATTEAIFEGCVNVDDILNRLALGIDGNAQKLLNDLSAQWSCYMQRRRFSEIDGDRYVSIGGKKKLLLQIDTGDEKQRLGNRNTGHRSGKSIISDSDVVAYVFEECFDTTIDSFKKLINDACRELKVDDAGMASLLKLLEEFKIEKFKDGRMVSEDLDAKGGDYRSIILSQLWRWVEARTNVPVDLKSDYDSLSTYLRAKVETANASGDGLGRLTYDEAVAEGNKKKRLDETFDIVAFIKKWHTENFAIKRECANASHPISVFVEYLCAICKQTKEYLSKYAEKIRTLPKGFSSDSAGDGDFGSWDAGNVCFWKGEDNSALIADKLGVSDKDCFVIKYKRHYDAAEGSEVCVVTNDGMIPKYCFAPYRYGESYIEPLSGTQCYLNSIDRVRISSGKDSDYEMISRLVENAMLRILIVDERVAKFVREHSKVISATYSILGIGVIDDKFVEKRLDEIDKEEKENTLTVSALDAICQQECSPLRKKDEGTDWVENIVLDEMAFLPSGLVKANARNVYELRTRVQEFVENGSHARLDEFVAMLRTRFASTWDILVIHQGIIDKWFPALAHDAMGTAKVLEALRHIFPYVVITTGRGTPTNIPPAARILPFSTIETTLFKKYPEKLILVDAIMNVLPKGENKGEDKCKRI